MEAKPMTKQRRALLIELEQMIGGKIWSDGTQNGTDGWDKGRYIRYPLRFLLPGDQKFKAVPENLSDDMLMTGYYAFGSNQLQIFHALSAILDRLEDGYSLEISEPTPDKPKRTRRRARRARPSTSRARSS
jgi:hypothetical protein